MTTREILIEARRLLAEPGAWCRGRVAEDAAGASTHASSPEARRFCALGAILRAAGAHRRLERALAISLLGSVVAAPILVPWHDHPHRTVEEVLAAFDRAIERCE